MVSEAWENMRESNRVQFSEFIDVDALEQWFKEDFPHLSDERINEAMYYVWLNLREIIQDQIYERLERAS